MCQTNTRRRSLLCGIRGRSLVAAALILPLGAVLAAPAAAMSCTRFELSKPVVLPDGTTHSGRSLELCPVRHSTPGLAWYAAAIDGEVCGVYLGRSLRLATDGSAATLAAFAQEGSALWLIGFARPDGAHGEMHTIFGSPSESVYDLAAEDLELVAATRPDRILLVRAANPPPPDYSASNVASVE